MGTLHQGLNCRQCRSKIRARRRRSRHGAALISALVFVVVVSLALAGIARLAVSHYERAQVESDYSCVLPLAEAGANYEFWKISQNTSNADQISQSNPHGVTYSFGSGTFTVYCTNLDGSTPWTPPNNLYVISTGSLNGTSRTIKVAVKGFSDTSKGKFALYTVDGISTLNGSAMTIAGDVGTNGQFSFSGHPGITGSIYFDGSAAGWSGGNPGGYNVINEPQPVTWPTIDQIANQMFPGGGMAWLATHNDNATKANPPISGNSISSATVLTGPGNFYVTNVSLHGQQTITFDNTNGPVNVWLGPDGGSGQILFRGGSAAIARSSTNPVTIYAATTGGVNLGGNSEMDASVYAYNVSGGAPYGSVTFGGTPDIYGSVITDQANIHGNVTINYEPGAVVPTNWGVGYYGFNNSWQELNPVNQ